MTFRKVTDEKILKAMYFSLYYHGNRVAMQKQQKKYREDNKDKVRAIWTNSSKKYRDKNKHVNAMYLNLVRLAKKDGLF